MARNRVLPRFFCEDGRARCGFVTLALALQKRGSMGDNGDKNRKVLVVDDSALMHRLYDTMLSECMDVVHANNGRQALDLLGQHRDTELVVLDINMPEMDGLSFLAEFSRD